MKLRAAIIAIILCLPTVAGATDITFNAVQIPLAYNGATTTPAVVIIDSVASSTVLCTPTGSIYPSYPRTLIPGESATTTLQATYLFSSDCVVPTTSLVKFVDDQLYVKSDGSYTYVPLPQSYYFFPIAQQTYIPVGSLSYATAYIPVSSVALNVTNQDIMNNASSTIPSCGFTQIAGCFGIAIAWAFYPSQGIVDRIQSLPYASTSPIGYVFDIRSLFATYATYDATSSVISVNMGDFIVDETGSSSAIVPIIDPKGMKSAIGATLWDQIQTIFGYCIWIMFGWYCWHRRNFV